MLSVLGLSASYKSIMNGCVVVVLSADAVVVVLSADAGSELAMCVWDGTTTVPVALSDVDDDACARRSASGCCTVPPTSWS